MIKIKLKIAAQLTPKELIGKTFTSKHDSGAVYNIEDYVVRDNSLVGTANDRRHGSYRWHSNFDEFLKLLKDGQFILNS